MTGIDKFFQHGSLKRASVNSDLNIFILLLRTTLWYRCSINVYFHNRLRPVGLRAKEDSNVMATVPFTLLSAQSLN